MPAIIILLALIIILSAYYFLMFGFEPEGYTDWHDTDTVKIDMSEILDSED